MFQRSLRICHSSLHALFLGAVLLFAVGQSPLLAQPAGFQVEIDPPFVIQGNEPITFEVVVNHPVALASYEWRNGNTDEILGTESSLTLQPNFSEPTPILLKVVDANGDEGRGFSFIETGNVNPTGFAVLVDPPFVIQGDDPMTFTASTDHTSPIVSYEWRNDLTGDVLGDTASITLDPNFAGPTPISVKLVDDAGEEGYGGTLIVTGDNGPAGFFVFVDPPFAFQEDQPIVFEAQTPDGTNIVSYEWKRLDTGDVVGTEQTLTLQPTFEVSTDFEVVATDDNGDTGRGFASVLVGGGPPNLLLVYVDPPVVIQDDDPIVLTATVDNPETVITAYRWVNDQTGEVLGDEQTLTLQPTFTEPTVISCEVTDDQGQTGMGCSLILPDGSNIPGLGVFIDPPVIVQEDEPMTFTAIPADGVTPQSYQWRNLNNGEDLGTGESITLDPDFDELTTIGVTLTDSENREYTAEALIIVDPIGPPILSVFIDPPLIAQEDEPMTFTALTQNNTGTAGSGPGLTYEWVREDTGAVIGDQDSVTLDPDFEDTTVIRVTVTDAENRQGEARALIVVGGIVNPEPWVMVDPPFVQQDDEPMTFTAQLADGHTAASYAWFNENDGTALGDGPSVTLDPDFEEITSIRVDVTDTNGDQASGFALIFVENIPDLFDVAINPPLAVQTDQPIVLEAVIPGGIDAPEFVWTNLSNGEVVGDSQSITLAPEFENSTSIGLSVQAADGSQGFAFSLIVVSSISASFTVTVDPPIVNQGVETLHFEASAPGGVTVTSYEWFNEETGASLGTGQSLDVTEPFNHPTLIRVEATDSGGALGVGYALVLVFPAGPDPNGDGQNTLADLHYELPNWAVSLTVKELMMINIGH